MSVVANVAINLDATKARAALAGLGSAVNQLGDRVSAVGRSMSGLAGVAASLGTGALVGGFVKAGIEADRTAKTIASLAGQYGETAKVTQFANEAADRFGLGQTTAAKAVADLYGRLRPMGISLKDIQSTFIGVNNAAARMNLSAADTEGVMLQLSQAMGSGALQGDELRSVMERLPAVGQAIATVMQTDVGNIKKLGEQGKITTAVIIQALNQLAGVKPPPPDPFKLFQKALEDLNTTIGTQLLPAFTPLVQKLSEMALKMKDLGIATTIANSLKPLADAAIRLLEAFAALNPQTQRLIIQLGAAAAAFTLIAAPIGIFLQGMGALIGAVVTVVKSLAGLKIFATIAGWLGALGPAIEITIGALLTLGRVIVGVFTGPVGWVALLVTAGIAVYAFRDKIAAAFNTIRNAIVNAFRGLAEVIKGPFVAIANVIRGVLNQVISGIGNAINAAVGAANTLIAGVNRAAARLKLPTIPFVPTVTVPRFAQGGVVDQPTLAMIGEGGQREYVVPESKATQFASDWMRQVSGKPGSGSTQQPVINLQTGPVVQQDGGPKYVTLDDLENVLRDFAVSVFGNARTAGGRRFQGVN